MARHIGTDLYDAFVAVAESGGFTAAVERVNRTQTTISQQIKRLEDIMGTDLFVRTNRHVELTSAGETLLPYARKILLLNEQATQAVSGRAEGAIRIGVPDIYSDALLPHCIELLRSLDSDAVPVVYCDHSMQLLEQFSNGALDVILAGRCREFAVGRTVCTEDLVWMGADTLDYRRGDEVPLILHSDGCPFRARALAALREVGIAWEVVYTGQSSAAISPSIMHGLGITAMPNRMIWSGLEDVGNKFGLPVIQSAPIDLHVSMPIIEHYGEDLRGELVRVAMEALGTHSDDSAEPSDAMEAEEVVKGRLIQA